MLLALREPHRDTRMLTNPNGLAFGGFLRMIARRRRSGAAITGGASMKASIGSTRVVILCILGFVVAAIPVGAFSATTAAASAQRVGDPMAVRRQRRPRRMAPSHSHRVSGSANTNIARGVSLMTWPLSASNDPPEQDQQPVDAEKIHPPSDTNVDGTPPSAPSTLLSQPPKANVPVVDVGRRQEENDQAVMDRLLMPSRLGQAFTSSLWVLVGLGFALNLAGYSILLDTNNNSNSNGNDDSNAININDGKNTNGGGIPSVRIGTMEERRFREEVVRDMRLQRQEQQQQQQQSSNNEKPQ